MEIAWKLFILAYLVFATGAYLIRRNLATTLSRHNRQINLLYFLIALYPLGLIIAIILRAPLDITVQNLGFIVAGSLSFPLVMVLAFKASQNLDAGNYAVLHNLVPVVTIASATVFLGERLANTELFAVFLLLLAAYIVTIPNINRTNLGSTQGLIIGLGAVTVLGLGVTFERFMLNRIEFGTYLVYGWGAQTFWMVIIARKHLIKAFKLFANAGKKKHILAYMYSNALKGICFVSALKLSGSASIVSAIASFLTVLVVISAYLFLNEKTHLWRKVSASLIGLAGLLILNLTR